LYISFESADKDNNEVSFELAYEADSLAAAKEVILFPNRLDYLDKKDEKKLDILEVTEALIQTKALKMTVSITDNFSEKLSKFIQVNFLSDEEFAAKNAKA